MSEFTAKEIKKLREATGAGVMDIRSALTQSDGEIKKAKEILKGKGLEKAASKAERETRAGLIETYVHADGRIGAMVHLACETDFVARTSEFKKLAKELAMQVAAMDPADTKQLLKQEYIRDPEKNIKELIAEVVSKTGENIQVQKISRFSLSDETN
jgi:elongation factor Ts